MSKLALERESKGSNKAKLIGQLDLDKLASFGELDRNYFKVKTPLGLVSVKLTFLSTHTEAEIVKKPFLVSNNQIWEQVEARL